MNGWFADPINQYFVTFFTLGWSKVQSQRHILTIHFTTKDVRAKPLSWMVPAHEDWQDAFWTISCNSLIACSFCILKCLVSVLRFLCVFSTRPTTSQSGLLSPSCPAPTVTIGIALVLAHKLPLSELGLLSLHHEVHQLIAWLQAQSTSSKKGFWVQGSQMQCQYDCQK